jgi:fatty acid desaturase
MEVRLLSMLTKANRQDTDYSAARKTSSGVKAFLKQKIWLPKFLYDGLPWFYLTAGVAALWASVYISAWFWVLPYYVLFSAACFHLGLIVIRRRRAPPGTSPETSSK